MPAGKLITFEGLDGCGKSTQLRLAKRWLAEAGVECVSTHEPGGTAIGEQLRRVLLDHGSGPMDGVLELLLVFASRRRHLSEVVEPALESGRHVLCDRFTDSSYAYQGSGRGVAEDVIAKIDHIATGARRPDRTLLFDLSPTAARERGRDRRRRRSSANEREADRLDCEDLHFYERVRQGFLDLAAHEPERFVVIDSSGSVEETSAAVRDALADLVGEA